MKTKSKIRRKRQPSPAVKAKRLALCHQSKEAKMVLKNLEMLPLDHPLRECSKVNDVLKYWHRETTGQLNPDHWDTFQGWKQRGFFVQKGEGGFLIWGKPRKMKGTAEKATEIGAIEEIEHDFKAFPLCYLFHAGQVNDEKGHSFDPDCPFQKLAQIPSLIKRAPLSLPAPVNTNTHDESPIFRPLIASGGQTLLF